MQHIKQKNDHPVTTTKLAGLQIHPQVVTEISSHAARFAEQQPFRHVVIDNFLDERYAKQLLAEFPAFERGNARNEAGELGRKSTVEMVRGLGPSYTALDNLIRSGAFLDLIGRITGIDDLLYDAHYFGGGTHESRNGQDLDAHVDFNRHPIENWHRRLNLIIYLNHEWEDAWGGSLELHTDPRAKDDQVSTITPLFNRCVIFETTESSWHGFPEITLPASHATLTRRSIALYFYTRDRPQEELAVPHSTIYVDRPLPEYFKPGHELSEADIQEIRVLLARRDQHNQRLYRDIAYLGVQLEQANKALGAGVLGRFRYLTQRLLARIRR